MPLVGYGLKTGEGHVPIDTSAQSVKLLFAPITASPPSVRFIGSMSPRVIKNAGSIGVGSWPDDAYASDPPWIAHQIFLTTENGAYYIPAVNTGTEAYPSVFWRLKPGVEIDLYAMW